MPENNQKFTISLGGVANHENTDISIEAPITVNGQVNLISDLPNYDSLILEGYTENDVVVYFVKNVNKDGSVDPNGMPYPERGVFYRFSWQNKNWSLIILGTHSHADMDFLDKLGEVDLTLIPEGSTKVLTLTKNPVDPDQQLSDEYSLTWEDQVSLPDLPPVVEGNNNPYLLMADPEGNVSWTNQLATVENIRPYKFKVTSENKKSDKQVVLLNNDLKLAGVSYYPETDSYLIIDNGQVLMDATLERVNLQMNPDCTCATDCPDDCKCWNIYDLSITIKDQDHIFEVGENIILMIFRNGLAGALNTLTDQYVTQDELVDYLTHGQVNLKNFVTKDYLLDLLKNYSIRTHTHDQYVKKGDYDLFDFRYSPYYHTHDEYLTKYQVESMLIGIGEKPADDKFTEFADSIREELDKINEKINSGTGAVTQEYLRSYVTSALLEYSKNTYETLDGQSLTVSEFLQYLDNKLSGLDFSASFDNIKLQKDIIVELGEDSPLGYNSGDIIQASTNLDTILRTMLRKKIPPVLKEPELTISYDRKYNYEEGTLTLIIHHNYSQNDAGAVISGYPILSVFTDKEASVKDPNNPDKILNINEDVSIVIPILPEDEDGFSRIIKITYEYSDGEDHKDNLGNSGYKISSGSISKILEIYIPRMYMIGGSARAIPDIDDPETISSDIINIITEFTKDPTICRIPEDNLDLQKIKVKYLKDNNTQSFIVLEPHNDNLLGSHLSEVINEAQGGDMLEDFTKIRLDVSPESNLKKYSDYDVYYYTCNQPIKANVYMTYIINGERQVL